MANIGSVVIDIGANVATLTKDMNQAKGILDRFDRDARSTFGAIGDSLGSLLKVGVIVGALDTVRRSITHIAEEGESIRKMAEQFGMTTESVSALKYAAGQTETSIESLGQGIKILSKNLYGAGDEAGNAAKAFKIMNVETRTAGGEIRKTDDILMDIADRFRGFEDGPAKAALAMKIFGKNGADLIPFLNQGSKGIKELKEEAERLGIVWSGSAAEAADKFGDSLKRMEAHVHGLAKAVAGPLISAFNDMFELFSGKKDVDILLGGLIEKKIKLEKQIAEKSQSFTQRGLVEDLKKDLDQIQREIDSMLGATRNAKKEVETKKTAAPSLPVTDKAAEKLRSALAMYEATAKAAEDAFSMDQESDSAAEFRKEMAGVNKSLDDMIAKHGDVDAFYDIWARLAGVAKERQFKKSLEEDGKALDDHMADLAKQQEKWVKIQEQGIEHIAKIQSIELDGEYQRTMDSYQKQQDALDDLNSKNLISTEDYYRQTAALSKSASDDYIRLMEKEYNLTVESFVRKIALAVGDDDRQRELYNQLEIFMTEFYNRKNKMVEDSTNKQIALANKLEKTFAQTYSELISGVNSFMGIFGASLPAVFNQVGQFMNQLSDKNSFLNKFGKDGSFVPMFGADGKFQPTISNVAGAGMGAYSTYQNIQKGDVLGSGASGAMTASMFTGNPVIIAAAAVIGAIAGAIGANQGKIEGSIRMNNFDKNKIGEGITNQNGSDYWHRSGNTLISTDNIGEAAWAQQIAKGFDEATVKMKDFFDSLDLDTTGFESDFKRKIDSKSATAEQIQQLLTGWFEEWMDQASGFDWGTLKQGTEDIFATMNRVVETVTGMQKMANFDLGRAFDELRDAPKTMKETIERMSAGIGVSVRGLEGLTGNDRLNQIAKITSLTASMYDMQIQYLMYIDTLQKSIADSTAGQIEGIKIGFMSEDEKIQYYGRKLTELQGQLAAATDPQSIESIYGQIQSQVANVNALNQQRYENEIQYIQYISDLAKSMSESIQTQIEGMQLDLMSEEQKVAFFNDKVHGLKSSLESASDPATIEKIVAQIQQAISSAWGSMGTESKSTSMTSTIDFLNEILGIAQGKLSIAEGEGKTKADKTKEDILASMPFLESMNVWADEKLKAAKDLELIAVEVIKTTLSSIDFKPIFDLTAAATNAATALNGIQSQPTVVNITLAGDASGIITEAATVSSNTIINWMRESGAVAAA